MRRENEILQTYRTPAVPEPDAPKPESAADPHLLAHQARRRARRVLKIRQFAASILFVLVLILFVVPEIRP